MFARMNGSSLPNRSPPVMGYQLVSRAFNNVKTAKYFSDLLHLCRGLGKHGVSSKAL
jgi:hypothetical protein